MKRIVSIAILLVSLSISAAAQWNGTGIDLQAILGSQNLKQAWVSMGLPTDSLTRHGTKLLTNDQALSEETIQMLFNGLSKIRKNDYVSVWDKGVKGYKTGYNLIYIGGSMFTVGSTAFTVAKITRYAERAGRLVTDKDFDLRSKAWSQAGLYTFLAGAVVAGTGGLIIFSSTKKMMTAVSDFNTTLDKFVKIVGIVDDIVYEPQPNPVTLTFGPAPSGIGLCLTF